MKFNEDKMKLLREWKQADLTLDTEYGIMTYLDYYEREIMRMKYGYIVTSKDYRGQKMVSIAIDLGKDE